MLRKVANRMGVTDTSVPAFAIFTSIWYVILNYFVHTGWIYHGTIIMSVVVCKMLRFSSVGLILRTLSDALSDARS